MDSACSPIVIREESNESIDSDDDDNIIELEKSDDEGQDEKKEDLRKPKLVKVDSSEINPRRLSIAAYKRMNSREKNMYNSMKSKIIKMQDSQILGAKRLDTIFSVTDSSEESSIDAPLSQSGSGSGS